MKKSYQCFNPECRSYKGAMQKDFCPACKGMIALKYETHPNISIKKAKVVVMVCNLEDLNYAFMHLETEPITLRKFLNKVPLVYMNAYFGYKSGRSKGTMLKDDKSLRFFKSKYYECSVFIMEKDGLYYIFAQPVAFTATKLLNESD